MVKTVVCDKHFETLIRCNNIRRRTENPANIYLLKVSNRNTRKRCEICSKSAIETLEKGVKYVQI